MKSPCKNCTNRHLTCHSVCPEYLKYREELERIKKKIDLERKSVIVKTAWKKKYW